MSIHLDQLGLDDKNEVSRPEMTGNGPSNDIWRSPRLCYRCEMTVLPRRPHERIGFAALVLLTLSPVVLHGLWRPLAQALGVEADSFWLSVSALVVAGIGPAMAWLGTRARGLPGALAGLVAALLSLFVGRSRAATAAVAAILLVVAGFCAALFPWLLRRLPASLDGLAARHKAVTALIAVLGAATVIGTTRTSMFMGDASRSDLSVAPDVPFLVHHSCLTAYVEGASLAARRVDNLYDMARWPSLNGTPGSETTDPRYAPFNLDAFAYPPPFLLLPHALLSWLDDFSSQRAFWFALNALFVAAGLWVLAHWLGSRAGLRALLLAPAIWVSAPTMATLQVGNVHLAVMVAGMLALVAFETRRPAVGGALLAFAILAKVSPGLLVVVLLVRRRFRELLWTAGFGVGFAALGALVFGLDPFVQFVSYELPRLGSGEALAFLADAESVPINLAPFGVPFKLAALGIPMTDPWATARGINLVFTVLLVVGALIAARKDRGPRATAELWAALLTLSSLRSPLAPGYVTFALLWLLSIRAIDVRGVGRTLGVVAIWLLLVVVPPLEPLDRLVFFTLIQQCVLIATAAYCLLRPSAPAQMSEPHRAPLLPAVA